MNQVMDHTHSLSVSEAACFNTHSLSECVCVVMAGLTCAHLSYVIAQQVCSLTKAPESYTSGQVPSEAASTSPQTVHTPHSPTLP